MKILKRVGLFVGWYVATFMGVFGLIVFLSIVESPYVPSDYFLLFVPIVVAWSASKETSK